MDPPRFADNEWVKRTWRVILLAFAAFAPLTGNAAFINGDASDTDVRADLAVLAADGTGLLPGGSGSPAVDRAAVFVFQLPALGAVANPFTTATFRFNLVSITGTPPTVDLYGLGRRSNSTVLPSDYYGQSTTLDPSDATYLQNNILIPLRGVFELICKSLPQLTDPVAGVENLKAEIPPPDPFNPQEVELILQELCKRSVEVADYYEFALFEIGRASCRERVSSPV